MYISYISIKLTKNIFLKGGRKSTAGKQKNFGLGCYSLVKRLLSIFCVLVLSPFVYRYRRLLCTGTVTGTDLLFALEHGGTEAPPAALWVCEPLGSLHRTHLQMTVPSSTAPRLSAVQRLTVGTRVREGMVTLLL